MKRTKRGGKRADRFQRAATWIIMRHRNEVRDADTMVIAVAAALRRVDKEAYRRGVEDGTRYGKGTLARVPRERKADG